MNDRERARAAYYAHVIAHQHTPPGAPSAEFDRRERAALDAYTTAYTTAVTDGIPTDLDPTTRAAIDNPTRTAPAPRAATIIAYETARAAAISAA